MNSLNHAADVGKGNIGLLFTFGRKLLLLNVVHVPDMKKNLISTDLLNKKGFKVMLESEK